MGEGQGVPPETGEADRAHVESHAAALAVAPPRVARLDPGATGLSGLAFGTRPRIVFLHGGQMNAHTWDGVILRLGRPALAYDLPGHGHSAHLESSEYSIAAIGRRLAERARLDCADKVLVVGHSLGGVCAIHLAAELGERAAGLVMIDASPEGIGSAGLGADVVMRGDIGELVGSIRSRAPNRSPAGLERGVRMNTREIGGGRLEWLWDPAFYRVSHLRRAERDRIWAALDGLRCEKVLIRGGESNLFPPDHAAQMLARAPGMRLHVVPGAGHNVHTDAPETVAGILRVLADDLLR